MAVIGYSVKIAAALVEFFANQAGARIFDEIFPQSVPTYFDEIYKQVQKIFSKELDKSVISELNGKINGIKDYVVNTYLPLKESGKISKADLFAKISPEHAPFVTNVIGPLESKRYAAEGLAAYMIAAGMNLCLLQEMAFLAEDEEKSAYVNAIKKNATSHIAHAQSTFDHVIESRKDKVILTKHSASASNMVTHHYGWKDTVSEEKKEWYYFGTMSGVHGDRNAEELAKQGRKDQKRKAVSKLIEDLGNPQKVIDLWKKLIVNPLPPT